MTVPSPVTPVAPIMAVTEENGMIIATTPAHTHGLHGLKQQPNLQLNGLPQLIPTMKLTFSMLYV